MNKLFYAFTLFILVSCTKYSQIYQVASTTPVTLENNYYTYEDEMVKIVYSFWDEYGVLSYSFYNKLNVPIYIDWKKCSFIRNGEKIDYWVDEIKTKSVTKVKGYNYGKANYYGLYSGSFDLLNFNYSTAITNSTSIRPQRIIFIAPNSSIVNIKFRLHFIKATKLNGTKATVKMPGTNKTLNTQYKDYTSVNSPLIFRNFMSISLSEDFLKERYIDNGFYVDKIVQLSKTKFVLPDPNYATGEMRYKTLFKDSKWFYINVEE